MTVKKIVPTQHALKIVVQVKLKVNIDPDPRQVGDDREGDARPQRPVRQRRVGEDPGQD